MTFYTNSKDAKVVINSLTSLEVEPFDKHIPESREVDLVLLDHDFFYADNEHTMHAFNVFVRRPDWGGLILERMKTSHRVFLFDRYCHKIRYEQAEHAFQFTPCSKPVLDARHTYLIHETDNGFLMCEEREALKALLEPFIFGDKLATRLVRGQFRWVKTHYQELCLKMARLTVDMKEQKEAMEQLVKKWNKIKSQVEDEEPLSCTFCTTV